jgi:ABC-type transporter MlaC component
LGSAENQQIQDYVQNLLNTTFNVLNDSQIDFEGKKNKIKTILHKNLDFDTMAKQVLGPVMLRSISAADLDNFKTVYANYLVSSYADVVKKYDGQRVQIKSVTPNSLGVYTVQLIILSNNNSVKFNIAYQVAKNKTGQFVIQDVISESISLVSTQRSDFASVLANNPKNINTLILKLNARIH